MYPDMSMNPPNTGYPFTMGGGAGGAGGPSYSLNDDTQSTSN